MKKDYILCLETSGSQTSVCVIDDKEVVTYVENQNTNSAASQLNLMIAEALSRAQITFEDLAAVALSGGPGSYTGLRIGAATAKGICFTLNIPLIHISTLRIMAAAAIQQDFESDFDMVLTAMDARNGNYYIGLYDTNLEKIQAESFLNIKDPQLTNHLNNKQILVVCNRIFNAELELQSSSLQISAKDMAGLTFKAYQEGSFESLDYYEPTYLTGFLK